MKRIITIKNVYGTNDKYVLKEEYEGFGIYAEKTPSGYFVHQSWLISNNENAELVIESYNNLCKEEVLDIIDNYNVNHRFGVKALMHCGSLHMHDGGKLM
jgi:hypothetical protein